MSFSNRVATFAAFSFAVVALIGVGTPGLAQDITRAINTSGVPLVPQPTPGPAIDSGETLATDPPKDREATRFSSLDAAVAAQPVPESLDADLRCMAIAIYFEAKGEPLSGQLAVAKVILNRTKSSRFPKTVCSVVTQRGQFSFVRGGRLPAIPRNAQYRRAVAVARVALDDAWDSPASDAMYFHARHVAPSWRRVQVAAIGNHLFYR